MSRSSSACRAGVLRWLLLVLIGSVQGTAIGNERAQPDSRAESESGKSVENGISPRAMLDAQAPSLRRPTKGKPVVRCWQEGRLVFESAGLMPVGKTQAAIELRSATDGTLLVVDLRQGLCIVETPSGS